MTANRAEPGVTDGTGRSSTRARLERNVPRSFLYAFLMDLSLTAPIWVLYLRDERGFSMTQITFLEVPLFLLIVFAEVPTGAVADRYGRRVSLMLASCILAVSTFVYGIATSYTLILLANLSWGLAFTFRSGADTALLYDSLKQLGREGEFQRLNGRFWALRSAAMLGGLLLGAPLAAATSYSFAIVSTAGIVALSLGAAWSLYETPADAEAGGSPRGSYLRTLGTGLRQVVERPSLRSLFLFSGVVGAGAAAPLLLLQQPWLAAHGIPTHSLGLWQAAANAAGILAALSATWWLARLGPRAAFATIPVGLFAFGAALGTVDAVGVGAAFLGMAFVRGLEEPLLSDVINRRIDSAQRATALSVKSLIGNTLMAISWPIAGAFVDRAGLQPVFLGYAVVTLALGTTMLLLWARAEPAPDVFGAEQGKAESPASDSSAAPVANSSRR